MAYIQNLLELYDNNSYNILIYACTFSFILFTLTFIGFQENELTFYFIWEKFYPAMVIFFIGTVLFLLGLYPDIGYDYFNLLIFAALSAFLILYLLGLFIKYRKIIAIFINHIKHMQYIIYFELFLLSMTGNLQLLEFLAALNVIWSLESLKLLYDLSIQKKEYAKKDSLSEDDCPTALLYPSRKPQLENFCLALKKVSDEPYAVMISGAWGVGKTSFVKALEKELHEDTFIWLETGGEKSVSEIMDELSQKLINVLRAKKVYLEDTDIIDRYFQAFSGIMAEGGWKFLDKIASIYHTDSPDFSTKKYLNRKLAALKSKVYLIVDDLDRCSEEYKSKMFKVIRESTQLTNCKTIFLANREAFLDKERDNQYIEKYISYQLELLPVAYSEIVNAYWNVIFDDTYFSDIRESIWHDRNSQTLQEEILGLPAQLLEALSKKQADLVKRKSSLADETAALEEIRQMKDSAAVIESDITNSRKVKNFMKSVKSDITKLNLAWKDDYVNEYFNSDWIAPIIRVQFLKQFFPDYYWELYLCNSMEKYQGAHAKIVKTMLEIPNNGMSKGEQSEILNLVIYQLDVLDFEKNKTASQYYLDELHGDSPNIAHIEQYINYITVEEQYADYFKVIALYDEHRTELSRFQVISFIQTLLQKMSQQYITDWSAFLKLSEAVIMSLQNSRLQELEISICQKRGQIIIGKCLECSIEMLKTPIYVIFGINIPKMQDELLGAANFMEVYHWLRNIDNSINNSGITKVIDALTFVQQYYKTLETNMQKPEYAEIYSYIKPDLANCQLMFSICRLWNDVSTSLRQPISKDIAFMKYFSTETITTGTMTYVQGSVLSIENLQEALDSLEKSYKSHESDEVYVLNLSLLFSQLLDHVLFSFAGNNEWFHGKEAHINSQIHRIADIAYSHNSQTDMKVQNMLKKIRIQVFDFSRRIRESDG